MSSNSPVPVPRTAVPLGISDPVEHARAELKAALFAIEEKSNIPKRLELETQKRVAALREFRRKDPLLAAAAVVGTAIAVGAAVWGFVRVYTR